jgi:AraC-like DNA-binding protein
VARALLETDRTLVEIAQDHDFADLSHLTRVFRRELGVPPGAFRRALREPEPGLESFNTEWSLSA